MIGEGVTSGADPRFEEAMRFVEEGRAFPSPAHFHARRLAWLLERSGLRARGVTLPWALVAGSAGKASTARFLAFIVRALLDRAGVGGPVVLATKPPLSETLDGQRERYQLLAHGEREPRWIEPEDFARQVDALRGVVADLEREAPELGPVAPYDVRYAVLWRWALEQGAAFAVIEANIGLRDDPTSALPPPRVQLLTPVDTDHAHLLLPPSPLPPELEGLGARAGPVWHKAGGLRAGVPAIVGLQAPEVARAIDALARAGGVPRLVRRGSDFEIASRSSTLRGSVASLMLGDVKLDVRLRALGGFQIDNAAHAAAAGRVLLEEGALPGGLAGHADAVTEAIAGTTMPGRMEVIEERPLTVLQIGASAMKMRGFVDALAELVATRGQAGRVVVCASFLARIHEPWEPIDILARAPEIDALIVTAVERTGDAADLAPNEVAARARRARPSLEVTAIDDPLRALAAARERARAESDVLIVVGNGIGALT